MKGTVIEKEGRFYKECGVVMLETTNRENTLWLNPKGQLIHTHLSGENKLVYKPQHLYITSDDKIKEGDWYLTSNNKILQCEKVLMNLIYAKNDYGRNPNGCKKIIATTDSSLILEKLGTSEFSNHDHIYNLPQPSQSFIEKYVEEYNKGNVITDVMVEYEDDGKMSYPDVKIPKVSPKDNTITIKKVKDTYSREDMIHALTYGCREGKLGRTHSDILIEYKQNHL